MKVLVISGIENLAIGKYADYPVFPVSRATLDWKIRIRNVLLWNFHRYGHAAGNWVMARVKWRALSNCLFKQGKF
ncbi:MAG: hypothetical protein LZF61_03965 [Nitrosomonas sp.]|nr:MAG: hypothetical protein LZF61_03965 [Nitrosomonas sp.]